MKIENSFALLLVLATAVGLAGSMTLLNAAGNVTNSTANTMVSAANTPAITNSTVTSLNTTTIPVVSNLSIEDPYAIISRSNVTTATVKQGQITTITIQDNGASGGRPPYTYQWLEQVPGHGKLTNATDCGAGNLQSTGAKPVPCIVSVNPSMQLGKYVFRIEVTDANNKTVIDDGFTLIITNLNLSTSLIVNTGNSTATGTASGGSGTYDMKWQINGTSDTSTPCTLTYNYNNNTTGQSTFILTEGAGYTDAYGCSYNLSYGTYKVKFTAADAQNLSDASSSTSVLVVDWPSGIFSNNTIRQGQSNTLTVAWSDIGYCGPSSHPTESDAQDNEQSNSNCGKGQTFYPYNFTVSLYSTQGLSCSPSGNAFASTSANVPATVRSFNKQATFVVSPLTTNTYCYNVNYYAGYYTKSGSNYVYNYGLVHTEGSDSGNPCSATITVLPALPNKNPLNVSLSGYSILDQGQTETLTATSTGGSTSNTFTFFFLNASLVPNAVIYGTSGPCANIVTSASTATCTFVEPVGEYKYGVGVTSNSQTANSGPIYLNVSNSLALNGIGITAIPSNIISGNSIQITVSWTGGAPTYTVQLYSSTTPSCSSSSTHIGSVQAGASKHNTTFTESPTSTLYYCATVTDSSNMPEIVTTGSVEVNVASSGGGGGGGGGEGPPIVFSVIANPSTPAIFDVGQSTNINAVATGGSGIYTYTWTSNGCSGIASSGTGNSFTYTPTAATAGCTFTFTANDGTTTNTASTAPAVVDTQPILSISPSNVLIDSGQYEAYIASVTGGSGPFNIELYNVTGRSQQGPNVDITLPGGSNEIVFEVSGIGSFAYNAIATDSGTTVPYTFNSASNTITVYNALQIISFTSSNSVIDVGQLTNITTVISGGIAPYTYNFIITNSTSAIVGNELLSGITSNTASYIFKPANAGTYIIDVGVTDSASAPQSVYDPINVRVGSPEIALTPSNTRLPSGGTETYTITIASNTGIGPFTAELFNVTAGANTEVGGNVMIPVGGGSNSISFPIYNTGTYDFGAMVTDLGTGMPYVFGSTVNMITVISNAVPPDNGVVLSVTPSSTSLTSGQSETFTISVNGGVGSFGIELVNLTGTPTQQGSNVIIFSPGGSNTITFPVSNTGTFTFNAIGTDVGSTTPNANYVFNSSKISISVSSSGGGGGPGGGGSGGGGGVSGGGGSGGAPPVQISTSGDCVVINNVGVPNSFKFSLAGYSFMATDNYIGANYTGIIINNETYVLDLNSSQQIGSSPVYMELTSVSYEPIEHLVNLRACTTTAPVSTINVTANVSNSSIVITNVQPSSFNGLVSLVSTTDTPNLPQGYTGIFVANLTVNSITVKTVNFTVNYQCYISPNTIQPFELSGGAWTPVEPFNVNSSTCLVNYFIPSDSTIGLFTTFRQTAFKAPVSSTVPTTTLKYVIVKTTPKPFPWWIVIVSGGLIAIISGAKYWTIVIAKRKLLAGAVK